MSVILDKSKLLPGLRDPAWFDFLHRQAPAANYDPNQTRDEKLTYDRDTQAANASSRSG